MWQSRGWTVGRVRFGDVAVALTGVGRLLDLVPRLQAVISDFVGHLGRRLQSARAR